MTLYGTAEQGVSRRIPAAKVPGTPCNLPMPPDPISEAVRLAEAAIADFEARMREVTPAYQRGDQTPIPRASTLARHLFWEPI